MKKFKFIDLFAGVGGFHLAMKELGGVCVYAAEINKDSVAVYKDNFGIDAYNDVTKVDPKDIPQHDVLCAGFPCQAFSNAGQKKGFEDIRGTLFFDIKRILEHHKPKFIILENVKHLVKHDKGNTWEVIKFNLEKLGYILTYDPLILSPHQIGIPQNRPRVYILGVHKDYVAKDYGLTLRAEIKQINRKYKNSIYSILEKNVSDNYKINKYEEKIINAWEDFYQNIGKKVYGFPVWVDEFGKDYNIEHFPEWKQSYIKKIRSLYIENKDFIEKWMKKWDVSNFKLRDRKFEWQAGANIHTVWDTSIQLRQSGIRFKKPDFFPALVAIVQTPIIAKYKRRLTPKEAAKLQSFPKSFKIHKNDHVAYRHFGNSVNVKMVKLLASWLFNEFKQEVNIK
jgi:DNA (cytosine-5)-methyltransferase 1